MKIMSTYSVKIKHYNPIFKETIAIYRAAVDFLIGVCLDEWGSISLISGDLLKQRYVEQLCHGTSCNPAPKYVAFDQRFYKFPSYLRRSAINEALGKVSSYRSNLASWSMADLKTRGHIPAIPKAGCIYPAMYRDNMFVRTGEYTASIKVFIRNTWDWLDVELRKTDVDYITRHCSSYKECVPTLQKRGKQWFLDFAFEQKQELTATPINEQRILSVDLGINHACACSAMDAGGTVLGRGFLSLPREKDSLNHAINRIKKAQQHGAARTPRLWNTAKGINDAIAVKTAAYVMDMASRYDVDVIVFEHLDLDGRKCGFKKQKLHLWRARYVQDMVTTKAHRLGIRISRVCAWGTSRLAFDGSGYVDRGSYFVNGIQKHSYSICTFPSGKTYNCDLNASYNIGARYFIREILKSLSVTARLDTEAKVPQCTRRSTCTLSTLISLNAVLAA